MDHNVLKFYRKGENKGGSILEEYIYRDKDNKPYAMVQRTDRHQFPQSKWVPSPDSETGGSYQPGAPKVKIPYNLPQLLKANPEEPIFICEGEKDADTVFDLGLVSTTNPSGAGKWAKELTKWFKGKQLVYILEDNDEPGYAHAQMVAKAMHSVGVAKVHIVKFRDLKEKEDVSDWVEKYDGDKAKLLERCAAAPLFKNLPNIVVEQANLPETRKKLQAALKTCGIGVLVRGNQLVQPLYDTWTNIKHHNGKTIENTIQVTRLKVITESNLHEISRRHACTFSKWNERAKKEVPCPPPDKLLRMLLDKGEWGSDFPKVKGCINAPTLRPDGSILSANGYDEMTGLWHYKDASLTLAEIPAKPTKADALTALNQLKALFKEVKFEDKKLDMAVALAALLTVTTRGAFDTAPMFLFNAPKSGTGKSYICDIIAHIITGRACPVTTLTGPKEEREKRIGSILMEGLDLMSLDNLETGSEISDIMLSQMLTNPLVDFRVLGKTGLLQCEWRGTLFATGNNVAFGGDMFRRGITCNLNANVADPERQKFAFDPVEEVMKHRGQYLAAVLTIAKAHHIAKNVKSPKPLNGFNGWSHFVKDALIWLGEDDVLKSQDAAKDEDPNTKAAEELVGHWAEGKVLKLNTPYKVVDIIELAAKSMANAPALQKLLLTQAGAAGGRPFVDPKRLGSWLKVLRKQVILNHKLTIAKRDNVNGHGWMLVAKNQ